MLDRDLAMLYGVETRGLNQAVKRNGERFPEGFMFRLTREEIGGISQSVTSSNRYKVLRFSKSVTVFTEHGVAMLSSVLNSTQAIQVNIQIMRAFSRFREMIAAHRDLSYRLDELERKYNTQFKVVFGAIQQLMAPPAPARRRIGFHPEGRVPGLRPGTL